MLINKTNINSSGQNICIIQNKYAHNKLTITKNSVQSSQVKIYIKNHLIYFIQKKNKFSFNHMNFLKLR